MILEIFSHGIIISKSASTPHYICQSILFENQIWAAIIDIRLAVKLLISIKNLCLPK
jgi:hypothetical protein